MGWKVKRILKVRERNREPVFQKSPFPAACLLYLRRNTFQAQGNNCISIFSVNTLMPRDDYVS
jgi:hypothetical protein